MKDFASHQMVLLVLEMLILQLGEVDYQQLNLKVLVDLLHLGLVLFVLNLKVVVMDMLHFGVMLEILYFKLPLLIEEVQQKNFASMMMVIKIIQHSRWTFI